VRCGVRRVLTSGGRASAVQARHSLLPTCELFRLRRDAGACGRAVAQLHEHATPASGPASDCACERLECARARVRACTGLQTCPSRAHAGWRRIGRARHAGGRPYRGHGGRRRAAGQRRRAAQADRRARAAHQRAQVRPCRPAVGRGCRSTSMKNSERWAFNGARPGVWSPL